MGQIADYTLSRLRKVGDADIYEVRLPDGTSSRFIYSGAQQASGRTVTDEEFNRWVEIAVRRAQRESDYMKAMDV